MNDTSVSQQDKLVWHSRTPDHSSTASSTANGKICEIQKIRARYSKLMENYALASIDNFQEKKGGGYPCLMHAGVISYSNYPKQ